MRATALLLLIATACSAMSSNAPGTRPPLPPIPCATPRPQPSAGRAVGFLGGMIALMGAAVVVSAESRGTYEPDDDEQNAILGLGGLGLLGVGVVGLVVGAAAAGSGSRQGPVCR
jgi:hypothetical protein